MSQVLELRHREPQELIPAIEPYLVFTNPGTLEMNLVKLLGVSVKESNDSIGFFGTGLKYAMATALRLGGSMTIITGGKRYEVAEQKITLRDKEFTQIMLNDEALGFTTELGKQWEAWMVVRELYSNALDENGETSVSESDLSSLRQEDRTAIITSGDSHFISRVLLCGDAFYEGKLQFTESYPSIEISSAFKSVCADLAARMPEGLNRSAIRFYQSRTQTRQPLVPANLTKVQAIQLAKATAFVKRLGFEEDFDCQPRCKTTAICPVL